MNRKNFLLTWPVLCCCFLRCYSGVPQPNVLFIVVDDLRPSLGCYGYPNSITPNIDQLAARSMLFTQAFSQQALCGPSRTSFLTSRRPDTTRVFANPNQYFRTFSGNFTTLPQHFKEHGYLTQSVGKIFHPGKLSDFTDDFPYSWSKLPFHPPTQQFMNAKVCPGPGGKTYKNIVCPVKVSDQPGGSLPDIQSTEFAIDFLKNQSQLHGTDKHPFFLAVGFHKPHLPLKYPEEYKKLFPLSEIQLAPGHTLPVKLPPVAWNPWQDFRSRDDVKELNVSFPYGPLPTHYQLLVRQSYYAATTYMDDMLGRLLSKLDELGFANNTIISFVGDHGWSLGEHQEWSKFSNFEVAVRVPLLMYVPGLTSSSQPSGSNFPYQNPFHNLHHTQIQERIFHKANVIQMIQDYTQMNDERRKINNELVELVDLFPTLSELAKLPVPPLCPPNSNNVTFCTEGVSFAPLLNKKSLQGDWKSAVFSQYPRPSPAPTITSDEPHLKYIRIMGYSMRTKRYRYTEWVRYSRHHFKQDWHKLIAKELYDHQGDALEGDNIAFDPSHKELVRKLSKQLRNGWRYSHPTTS